MITTTTNHLEGYRITEYLGTIMDEFTFGFLFSSDKIPEGTDAIIGISVVPRVHAIDSYGNNGDLIIGTAVKIEKV